MKVLVLCGGNSDEREVSLRSGAAVQAALQAAGYEVVMADPADDVADSVMRSGDVIFPALHGKGGEDGVIQKRIEGLGLHYVGSDSQVSDLCFDKWAFKQKLQAAGLPVPAAVIVGPDQPLAEQPLAKQPFVLKPVDGGSSVDTFIVRDVAQADWPAMQAATTKHQRMLLERLIGGVEITVGVLDEHALPVIEIVPPANGEFDYDNKYNGKTGELCPPLNVSQAVQHQAQELALQVHRLCGCRDLSRTDFMIDQQNQIWILEVNTLPGMTDQSLFPKAAAVEGFSMPVLCDRLVRLAQKR